MKANISKWVHDDYRIKIDGITYGPTTKASTGLMQIITGRSAGLTQKLRTLRLNPTEIAQFPTHILGVIGDKIADELEWQTSTLEEVVNSMVNLDCAITLDDMDFEIAAVAAFHQRRTAPVGMTVFVAFMLPDESTPYIMERMK